MTHGVERSRDAVSIMAVAMPSSISACGNRSRQRKGRRKEARLVCAQHIDACRYAVRPWTIFCDFDGTISTVDVTDELLTRFARPGWQSLEEAWRTGQIGSRECMSGQMALLDAGAEQINALLDTVRIDPAFPDFVAAAQAAGVDLVVVSDGLDTAIERILARHGLSHLRVVANHLEQVADRQWRMLSPHTSDACLSGSGTCKCACAKRSQELHRTLLIGDGQSDFCAAGAVDFVFAIGKLTGHCRQLGLRHRSIDGFREAIALLPDLLAGRLVVADEPADPSPTQRIRYA